MNNKFPKLIRFVADNDDTFFRSSPLISDYVESNWPQFGAKYLKTKERTISIIQTFYNIVNEEIEKSINEKRPADLEKFGINFPITNQSFESKRLATYNRTIDIIKYMYRFVQNEIMKSKKIGRAPQLPNFNVNRNDVIRGVEAETIDVDYELYIRPLEEILESLEDIISEKNKFLSQDPNSFILPQEEPKVSISEAGSDYIEYVKSILECLQLTRHSKEMFMEIRDATLEADGKLPSGRVPYDKIYEESSWFPYLRNNVCELYNVFGERMISLTAHNGIDNMHGREFEAKGDAVHSIEPNIIHYGQRFHSSEHIPGIRRPRADKGETVKAIDGVDNLRGYVFLDDSLENLRMVEKHGATPILINYDGRPNPYGYAMVRSTKPESIYRELERCGYGETDGEILQRPKTLTKTK